MICVCVCVLGGMLLLYVLSTKSARIYGACVMDWRWNFSMHSFFFIWLFLLIRYGKRARWFPSWIKFHYFKQCQTIFHRASPTRVCCYKLIFRFKLFSICFSFRHYHTRTSTIFFSLFQADGCCCTLSKFYEGPTYRDPLFFCVSRNDFICAVVSIIEGDIIYNYIVRVGQSLVTGGAWFGIPAVSWERYWVLRNVGLYLYAV